MTPQEVVERAVELSEADGCVVVAEESSAANLRWAGNTLTTNGVSRARTLTVVAVVDGVKGAASGVVSRSNVGPDEVERVVRLAEQAARASGPAEDAAPLVPGDPPGPEWDAPPAETSAAVFADFAPALGEAFRAAESQRRELFGFAEHRMQTTYLANSAGLRLRHDQPTGRVEITGKSDGRTKSSWTGRHTRDFTDIDVAALDTDLRNRLTWAERSVELPAGRYETLLPPSALADLMVYLYWSATARDAAEGRSVFSRPGGGTRVGERLGDTPVNLYGDPGCPGLQSASFVVTTASGPSSSVFDNGLPLDPTYWIRRGELAALVQTRHSAGLTGLPATPAVGNLVLDVEQPSGSLPDLIGRTRRGLLLTCLWYIREVDPRRLLLTGLTRDGVYLVENGEVTGAVTNFRFNESPVDLLGRLREVGDTEPTLPREFADWFTRAAMPPVRVADFHMSSVSPAS